MNAREEVLTAYCQMYPELISLAKGFLKGRAIPNDLVQDLYFHFERIPTTKIIDRPVEFIKKSLYNKCLNWYDSLQRSAKNYKIYDRDFAYAKTSPTIEQLALENEWDRYELLAEFANTLEKKQRKVLHHVLDCKTISEIQKIEKCAYSTAKTNRRLMILKLKIFFAERGKEFNYERIKVSSAV